ncbi:cell wall biogenesis protein [Penicillium daleae]|uniref:Cell wall biogenesis protein n=1 Tax=Penicillium daleae TaxID=63821 RepID=A0AAD6G913_9EURO|nr:cell wall biogenesis protein [Penicillium daleae]KAJ5464921.1 cell wall biogenesis protein [Penicillium daleae]
MTPPTSDTPSYCTADFSLIPAGRPSMYRFLMNLREYLKIGSSTSSFAHEIAGVQQLVRESGLKSEMHPTGTLVGKYPTIVFRSALNSAMR